MTEGEKADHKEKVQKVMVDHLTSIGYPDITHEQIMNELKNMWVKIEEAGLVVEDMCFEAFAIHAQNAYTFAKIQEVMGI